MTYNNENALAEVKNFTLPAMIESDFPTKNCQRISTACR